MNFKLRTFISLIYAAALGAVVLVLGPEFSTLARAQQAAGDAIAPSMDLDDPAPESSPSGEPADFAEALDPHARGRAVYLRYCLGCHGIQGDGKGEAAAMLYPPPRDFVEGAFKFSSRRTPGLPTDDDLFQVVTDGLAGTSMTGFVRLPDADRRAVVAYIKTFSDRWPSAEAEAYDPPIPATDDPWAGDPEAGVLAGDRIYHAEALCMTCHPSYHDEAAIGRMSIDMGYEPLPLRADWRLSVAKKNSNGTLTLPPDFMRDRIKTGGDIKNLYRVIGAGITTTAMPTWVDSIEPEKLWGLAHYINSLAALRSSRLDPESYLARPPVDRLHPAPLEEVDELGAEEFFEDGPGEEDSADEFADEFAEEFAEEGGSEQE